VSRSVDGVHWADLDGLRALAILLVLARHSLRPFVPDDAYQSVVTIGPIDLTPSFLNGWIGVDLFFVLSGFLIGCQAWRGDSLLRFWFKRVTRILPAYCRQSHPHSPLVQATTSRVTAGRRVTGRSGPSRGSGRRDAHSEPQKCEAPPRECRNNPLEVLTFGRYFGSAGTSLLA
jgi:hypothetical protein